MFCYTPVTQMCSLNCNEKVTCENFGTQTMQKTISRQKRRYSLGTIYCTYCPSFRFSKTCGAGCNYHVAKKHSRFRPKKQVQVKFLLGATFGSYSLPKQRSNQHGSPIKTSNLDIDTVLEDSDDTLLKEERNSCKQFLTDFEFVKGRHSVFLFTVSSTRNRIRCTDNSNVPPKSTLHSGFFWNTLKVLFYTQKRYDYGKVYILCIGNDMESLKEK